jgi:hypothetical protein
MPVTADRRDVDNSGRLEMFFASPWVGSCLVEPATQAGAGAPLFWLDCRRQLG